MHLYSGTSVEFIQDATHNQIAEKLEKNFEDEYRYKPGKSEVQSWRESLTRMARVLRNTAMLDHGVVVELQLPLTSKRLDC
ncbi:MAG: peptidase S24, partial [Acidimicrobiia bacterium]